MTLYVLISCRHVHVGSFGAVSDRTGDYRSHRLGCCCLCAIKLYDNAESSNLDSNLWYFFITFFICGCKYSTFLGRYKLANLHACINPEYFDTFSQSLFRSKLEKYAFQRVKHAYKYLMIRKKDKERVCHCKIFTINCTSLRILRKNITQQAGREKEWGFFSGGTATKSLYFVWLSLVISQYSF